MATPVGPDMSGIERTRQQQMSSAAFQRGDVGRAAAEGDKSLKKSGDDKGRRLDADEYVESLVRDDASHGNVKGGKSTVESSAAQTSQAADERQAQCCPPPPGDSFPPCPPPGGHLPPAPMPPPPVIQQPWQQYQGQPIIPTAWPIEPFPGYGQMPLPQPPPGSTYPSDPFAPVMTAGGVIRQTQQDGSLFISLPNSIVLNQFPEGQAFAYDARAQAPIPAETRKVTHPGVGEEMQYDFTDAAGNSYTMFSKSLDFIAESPAKDVKEMVYPTGNVFILAQTMHKDPFTGEMKPRTHRLEIQPNGLVNTYGEKGVMVGLNKVQFLDGNEYRELPLPYPIPGYQGYENDLRALNPASSTGPVSGPPEGFPPPQAAMPPPTGTAFAAAPTPQAFPLPTADTAPPPQAFPLPTADVAPPPQAFPSMPPTQAFPLPSADVAAFPPPPPGTTGFPPAAEPVAAAGSPQSAPGADRKPPCPECPTVGAVPGRKQEPVKKGIWEKVKDFFSSPVPWMAMMPAVSMMAMMPMMFNPFMCMPYPMGMYTMNPMGMMYQSGMASTMGATMASMHTPITPYGMVAPYPMNYFISSPMSPFWY